MLHLHLEQVQRKDNQMQILSNFFVVKDKEELGYLEGYTYKVWNDDYVKSAAFADTSHFRQFPEFLSKALDWRLALNAMYPNVQLRCLASYGYYNKKALMYAEDKFISHLIQDYIIVKTNKEIDLDVQLYWPERAYREGFKDAYHKLSEYHKG